VTSGMNAQRPAGETTIPTKRGGNSLSGESPPIPFPAKRISQEHCVAM
jgi:hypothetical protein